MEWLDGLIALIASVSWAEYRVRHALKHARALHDGTNEVSRELYQRTNLRLSHHIQSRTHDR
jgi:hypothetical protein